MKKRPAKLPVSKEQAIDPRNPDWREALMRRIREAARGDPFAVFTEWASEADDEAYRFL